MGIGASRINGSGRWHVELGDSVGFGVWIISGEKQTTNCEIGTG